MRTLICDVRLVMRRRRVATFRVLKSITSPEELTDLSLALPHCGYSFSEEPWEHALIAFGIDPGEDPECRRYQTFKFPYSYDPIIAEGPATPLLTGEVSLHRVIRRNHGNNSHIFDGILLLTDDKVWQYCDIVDDQLKRI
jgi:hypothetical protein